jgi:hypothetical protein
LPGGPFFIAIFIDEGVACMNCRSLSFSTRIRASCPGNNRNPGITLRRWAARIRGILFR